MKTLSIAFAALIVMAIGAQAADSVTSVNIVGYNSMTLEDGKRYIMSAPLYDPAGDGTNTLIGIFGTDQLVQSFFPTTADRVILFDTVVGAYQNYAQFTDGHFYKANNGTEWAAKILADDDVIETGSSFWIVHPAGAADSEIALLGEVLGGASHTQDVAIVTGYQLAASPYASVVEIQSIAKTADGATSSFFPTTADRIVTWDTVAQAYQSYALFTDDTWYKANDGTEWASKVAATGSISLGEGFWYISQGDMTITRGCPYSSAY